MRHPVGLFPYLTTSFRTQLKILDSSGGSASLKRRQQIRFLEDGVSVFIDRIWGDGLLLHDYSAGSGMRIVDFIRTEKGYVVVLGLPRTFGKGEVFEVETSRRILGAFMDREAYMEAIMPGPTQSLSMEVVAPRERRIVDADVVVPSLRGVEARQRPGRLDLRVSQADINVPYRLAWSWN